MQGKYFISFVSFWVRFRKDVFDFLKKGGYIWIFGKEQVKCWGLDIWWKDINVFIFLFLVYEVLNMVLQF